MDLLYNNGAKGLEKSFSPLLHLSLTNLGYHAEYKFSIRNAAKLLIHYHLLTFILPRRQSCGYFINKADNIHHQC